MVGAVLVARPPLATDKGTAAVAKAVNAVPLVLVQVMAPALVIVQSALIVTGVKAVVAEATSI
jgi:hypothetical protein